MPPAIPKIVETQVLEKFQETQTWCPYGQKHFYAEDPRGCTVYLSLFKKLVNSCKLSLDWSISHRFFELVIKFPAPKQPAEGEVLKSSQLWSVPWALMHERLGPKVLWLQNVICDKRGRITYCEPELHLEYEDLVCWSKNELDTVIGFKALDSMDKLVFRNPKVCYYLDSIMKRLLKETDRGNALQADDARFRGYLAKFNVIAKLTREYRLAVEADYWAKAQVESLAMYDCRQEHVWLAHHVMKRYLKAVNEPPEQMKSHLVDLYKEIQMIADTEPLDGNYHSWEHPNSTGRNAPQGRTTLLYVSNRNCWYKADPIEVQAQLDPDSNPPSYDKFCYVIRAEPLDNQAPAEEFTIPEHHIIYWRDMNLPRFEQRRFTLYTWTCHYLFVAKWGQSYYAWNGLISPSVRITPIAAPPSQQANRRRPAQRPQQQQSLSIERNLQVNHFAELGLCRNLMHTYRYKPDAKPTNVSVWAKLMGVDGILSRVWQGGGALIDYGTYQSVIDGSRGKACKGAVMLDVLRMVGKLLDRLLYDLLRKLSESDISRDRLRFCPEAIDYRELFNFWEAKLALLAAPGPQAKPSEKDKRAAHHNFMIKKLQGRLLHAYFHEEE